MTTKVTVDAHAGWPVGVREIVLTRDGEPTGVEHYHVVKPGEVREFCVHSHMELHVAEGER